MSDWAAKLSQTPKAQAAETSSARANAAVAGHAKGAASAPSQGKKKNTEASGVARADSGAKKAAATGPKTEAYNYSEVVNFLHTRFERDLAEARAEKDVDKWAVYRSLDSASAWNTSSSGSKKSSEDEFSLLRELNRVGSRARKA